MIFLGDLTIKLGRLHGLEETPQSVSIVLEVDRYGYFYRVVASRVIEDQQIPNWRDEYIIDLQCRWYWHGCQSPSTTPSPCSSTKMRVLVYQHISDTETRLLATRVEPLSKTWLRETLWSSST